MFQPPHTITIHLHSCNIIIKFPFYSPSFSPLPKLIIFFLLNKLAGTNILQIKLKIMSEEKKIPMIRVRLLKRKRKKVKVDPKFGGQWKVKEKVLCLVANERWKKNHFHLFPFSPQPILLKPSIFPFNIKVLFYHGSKPLFICFLLFPWPINYDRVFWYHKSPPHSLSIRFC